MRLQGLILIVTVSLFFIGCNDDVGTNRGTTRNTQTQTAEKVTTYSGIHRDRRSSPITYQKEINIDSDSANIRRIPDIHFDDEGGDGKNAITRSVSVRPTVHCGETVKATLKEKIADCASIAKNGDKAIWNGTTEAGNAEATWNLVTLSEITSTGDEYEVWQDGRTGMVWSHIVEVEGNWCESAGNQQGPSDTVAADCLLTGKGISLCTNLALAELPGVTWRLPTRADYLQADLDGIRFVLTRGNNFFWTATVSSDVTKRDKAWVYKMVNGTLTAEPMTADRSVRCIGTPNF